jgi:hypothetical protein
MPDLLSSNARMAKDPMPAGIKNRKTPVSIGSIKADQNTTRFMVTIKVIFAALYFLSLSRSSDVTDIRNKQP